MNEKNISFSPNREENVVDLSNSTMANICLTGLVYANGQLSYNIDFTIDSVYPFSNGNDSGYATFDHITKQLEIFGSVKMYIVYN